MNPATPAAPKRGRTREDVTAYIASLPPEDLRPSKRKNDKKLNQMMCSAQRLFGGWQQALTEAGLDPAKVYSRKPFKRQDCSLNTLVDAIRAIPQGELNSKAVQRHPERSRLYSLAQRLLGGWDAALLAAQINPTTVRKRRRGCSTDEIINYIHFRKRMGQSLAYRDVVKSEAGRRFYRAATREWRDTWISPYVGWAGAVDEAGYDVDEEGLQVMFSRARPRQRTTA